MAAPERPDRGDDGLLELIPAAGRLLASTWWHTTEWTVGAGVRAGTRIARAALGQEPPPRDISDLVDRDRRRQDRNPGPSPASLRQRGAELLERSADVEEDEDLHPAFARILENLSPDEARILRLLATGGPQPAIDVRTGLPLVSELVAGGLNMIGAEAGCRHVDRVPAYLDNLNRLGLIWFSRETLRELAEYQVLESQPEVLEAMRRGGRTARTVRRSIHLTAFGTAFCEVCLPLDTAEIEALPREPPEREPRSGEGRA